MTDGHKHSSKALCNEQEHGIKPTTSRRQASDSPGPPCQIGTSTDSAKHQTHPISPTIRHSKISISQDPPSQIGASDDSSLIQKLNVKGRQGILFTHWDTKRDDDITSIYGSKKRKFENISPRESKVKKDREKVKPLMKSEKRTFIWWKNNQGKIGEMVRWKIGKG